MASNKKNVFRILDDISPSEMKLRGVPRPIDGLTNMFINELGQVEKRKGFKRYNTTTLNSSHPIVGMHRYYNEEDETKEFIIACNSKLVTLGDIDPHSATILKGNSIIASLYHMLGISRNRVSASGGTLDVAGE